MSCTTPLRTGARSGPEEHFAIFIRHSGDGCRVRKLTGVKSKNAVDHYGWKRPLVRWRGLEGEPKSSFVLSRKVESIRLSDILEVVGVIPTDLADELRSGSLVVPTLDWEDRAALFSVVRPKLKSAS